MIPVRLEMIFDRLKGPTREQLAVGNQWAITALNRYHSHSSANFEFHLDDVGYSCKLNWDSDFSTAAMKEKKDIANHGAVAIAMFVMSVLLGYSYVEQTEIGDGVDYKFMEKEPADDELNFMSNGHYVEVSGLLEETPSNTMTGRIDDKHKQIARGRKRSEPASVIVTLFKQPKTIKQIHS